MTRAEFLKRLNQGLAGMPDDSRADIMGDYDAYFDAGLEAGRSEAEIAAALGDPRRLARELKLEAGIRRWQEGRTPSSALSAVIAFLGLGAIDILILLPVLLPVLGVMLALYVAMLGTFIAGGAILVAGPFSGFPGGAAAALLCGFGVMAAAIAITALLMIATVGLVNLLLWYGRLHYQIIKPAIETVA